MITKYRDVFTAESAFDSGSASYTEAEQEQICGSLENVSTLHLSESRTNANVLTQSADQHLLILDAFASKYEVFTSVYRPVISTAMKTDESATDQMAFKVIGIAPACNKAALEDVSKKFTTTTDQYDA
jgi:hypothetical protein